MAVVEVSNNLSARVMVQITCIPINCPVSCRFMIHIRFSMIPIEVADPSIISMIKGGNMALIVVELYLNYCLFSVVALSAKH